MKSKSLIVLLALLSMFGMTGIAHGAVVSWTDWTSGVTGPAGAAVGTISLGGSTIAVRYTGDITFLQTAGGTNWWTEGTPAPYTGNSVIDNAPPASDIIALSRAVILNRLEFAAPLVSQQIVTFRAASFVAEASA